MKILAWLSVALGTTAVVILLAVALGVSQFRSQVFAGRLPLEFVEAPEMIAFAPSLLLGLLAAIVAIPTLRQPRGRLGLLLGVASLLGVSALIGLSGLYAFF